MFKLILIIAINNSNVIGVPGIFYDNKYVEVAEYSSLELCKTAGYKRLAEFKFSSTYDSIIFRCKAI